jgi:hypothetical protein
MSIVYVVAREPKDWEWGYDEPEAAFSHREQAELYITGKENPAEYVIHEVELQG